MTPRKKIADDAVEALAEAWEQGGQQAIETVRRRDPAAYLRIMASLTPASAGLEAPGEEDDDDLEAVLAAVARVMGDG